MTLFIQDHETEDAIFQTEDFSVVPNKGESLMLDGKWYDVVERISRLSTSQISTAIRARCLLRNHEVVIYNR